MTFIQPFASPEVDLEGMRLSAFMSAIIITHQLVSFFFFLFPLIPLHFPTCPPCHFPCFFSLSLSFCLCYTAEGSKCKSSGAIFFSRALISADDVSKEVKGTAQRPPQLLSSIHCVQIYVSLALFSPLSPPLSLSFLPHFQHYQYRSGCALRTSL